MSSPALPFPFKLLTAGISAVAVLATGASCTAPGKPYPTKAGISALDAAFTAAQRTWESLPPAQTESEKERTRWRASLGGLLTALERRSPPSTWTGTQSIDGWTVTFNDDDSGLRSIAPSSCETITAVDPGRSLRKIETRAAGEGAGLPVVMAQRKAGNADPFFPPNGRHLPATFTAEFSSERKVTLTFYDTRKEQTARLHGAARALAYDFSTPVAEAMSKRALHKYVLPGLLRPESHLEDAGIYTPEPYDPRKVPVVLVHGLESAPYIWANVMNSIAADPVLRAHYQVWYFLYPSGMTVQAAAATLRRSLNAARNYYDPRHRNEAMQRMVIAGHSLGGLLAQMQVIDSKEEIYRAFFQVPFEELPVSGNTRAVVRESLYFKPLPYVKRVIFISTPHRGSKLADLSIWRFLMRILPPDKLIGGIVKEITSAARTALNPQLARFRYLGTSAAEGLSPAHPLLAAMCGCRIVVPYHNIIAVFQPFGGRKPVEQTSDGIVPYSSAWLPGAESTATVKGFHTCAENPAVAKEIDRILRLHLRAGKKR